MNLTDGFQNNKKGVFFAAAILLFMIILLLPTPAPVDTGGKTLLLTAQGKASLAVLTLAVLLWVTEAIPFPVTGLFSLSLLVITKVSSLKDLVQEGFGNRIIIFFIGVLIFSAAIAETTLLKRVAAFVLFHLGHSARLIILAFLTVGALLSGWITDMAVAAMLLPLGVSILRDAGAEPLKSNFGRALMISCAWGALIGGIATPAGCGPNPLTMGFLRDLAGIEFSFLDWMIVGMPAMFLMIPCAWIILLKCFPLEEINLKITEEEFKQRFAELGRLTRKEIWMLVIFGVTIFLWIFGPLIENWIGSVDYLSIYFVALTFACVLFFPGINVLSWKQAEQQISWGGIILIVTGLAMGMAIYNTGAAEWLAWMAFHSIGALTSGVDRVCDCPGSFDSESHVFQQYRHRHNCRAAADRAGEKFGFRPGVAGHSGRNHVIFSLYSGHIYADQCDSLFFWLFFDWRHGQSRHLDDDSVIRLRDDFYFCYGKIIRNYCILSVWVFQRHSNTSTHSSMKTKVTAEFCQEAYDALAKEYRYVITDMICRAGSGHLGGALSLVEIVITLYHRIMKIKPEEPRWDGRDRLVMSKGHAGPVLYVALAEMGFFPEAWLKTLNADGTRLPSHVDQIQTPGVDMTAGSLGQGLSCACGLTLAARKDRKTHTVFCIIGDGECNEGQIWEAAMFAGHHKLDQLVAICDYNKLQLDGTTDDMLTLEPFVERWRAFGWQVFEMDGHNWTDIYATLTQAVEVKGRPAMIIAHTIKAKGNRVCENQAGSHNIKVPDQAAYDKYMQGLGYTVELPY